VQTVTSRQPPNLILLLYADRSDPVSSVVLERAARFNCAVTAISLSQLVNEVVLGAHWTWAARTIDPSRTAVVNRLTSIEHEGATNPLASSFQRQQFWIRLNTELQRFAYVSSMPTAVSPIGSLGSLLDQWSDLPELVAGLRVPVHQVPWKADVLHGDVHIVNPWHLYSLGRRVGADPGPAAPGQLVYVRPAGMLFHVAQVGSMMMAANAPPGMSRAQQDYVVAFAKSMAALSGTRILEHAFFVGDGLPVFYSTCPVPVITGRMPAYADMVVEGLHDDIKQRSPRIAA
jgi:hypothetical protein